MTIDNTLKSGDAVNPSSSTCSIETRIKLRKFSFRVSCVRRFLKERSVQFLCEHWDEKKSVFGDFSSFSFRLMLHELFTIPSLNTSTNFLFRWYASRPIHGGETKRCFFLEEKSSGAMFMNIDESRTEKMLKKS